MQPLPGPSAPGALAPPEASGLESARLAEPGQVSFADTLAAVVEAISTDEPAPSPSREAPPADSEAPPSKREEPQTEHPAPASLEALASLTVPAPLRPTEPGGQQPGSAPVETGPVGGAAIGAVRLATWDLPSTRATTSLAPAAQTGDALPAAEPARPAPASAGAVALQTGAPAGASPTSASPTGAAGATPRGPAQQASGAPHPLTVQGATAGARRAAAAMDGAGAPARTAPAGGPRSDTAPSAHAGPYPPAVPAGQQPRSLVAGPPVSRGPAPTSGAVGAHPAGASSASAALAPGNGSPLAAPASAPGGGRSASWPGLPNPAHPSVLSSAWGPAGAAPGWGAIPGVMTAGGPEAAPVPQALEWLAPSALIAPGAGPGLAGSADAAPATGDRSAPAPLLAHGVGGVRDHGGDTAAGGAWAGDPLLAAAEVRVSPGGEPGDIAGATVPRPSPADPGALVLAEARDTVPEAGAWRLLGGRDQPAREPSSDPSRPSAAEALAGLVPSRPEVPGSGARDVADLWSPAAHSLPEQVALGLDAAARGAQAVRLHLQPEGLGTVLLHVARGEQGISVRLGAESAATRELLQASMPQLAQALDQRGLPVAQLVIGLAGGGVGADGGPPREALMPRPSRRSVQPHAAAPGAIEPLASSPHQIDYRV